MAPTNLVFTVSRLDRLKTDALHRLVEKFCNIPNPTVNKAQLKQLLLDHIPSSRLDTVYMDLDLRPHLVILGPDNSRNPWTAPNSPYTLTYQPPKIRTSSLLNQDSSMTGQPLQQPPGQSTYQPVRTARAPSPGRDPAPTLPQFEELVSMSEADFRAQLNTALQHTLSSLETPGVNQTHLMAEELALHTVSLTNVNHNTHVLQNNIRAVHNEAFQAHQLATAAFQGMGSMTTAFNSRLSTLHSGHAKIEERQDSLEQQQQLLQRDTEKSLREKKLVVFGWCKLNWAGRWDYTAEEDAMRLFQKLQIEIQAWEFDVHRLLITSGPLEGNPTEGKLKLEFFKIASRNRLLTAYNDYANQFRRLTGLRPPFNILKDKSPAMIEDDKDTQARVDFLREQSRLETGRELDYRKRDNGVVTLVDERGRSSLVSRAILDAIPRADIQRMRDLRFQQQQAADRPMRSQPRPEPPRQANFRHTPQTSHQTSFDTPSSYPRYSLRPRPPNTRPIFPPDDPDDDEDDGDYSHPPQQTSTQQIFSPTHTDHTMDEEESIDADEEELSDGANAEEFAERVKEYRAHRAAEDAYTNQQIPETFPPGRSATAIELADKIRSYRVRLSTSHSPPNNNPMDLDDEAETYFEPPSPRRRHPSQPTPPAHDSQYTQYEQIHLPSPGSSLPSSQ